ncbi:6-hydroxynicotinate 3-monooxygenase [Daldinia childiae]|uniref:6-hydroxynicotinate 3-monooxygenase n=1 Tax=Daldinia childiae TaxID=326645 RepID=UPI0014453666|nr:6-hydroxynicotinate 3-monooxygenase [Daldinia childiae]KAF3068299.1 6-hydroxynicotinate 3-monooxygenase [Daldinia childiae]
MTSKDQLSVIIVGSGLAGLATARVLREKCQVTVYERRSPSVATGGQGITNFPNATKIMSQLGYDMKRSGSVAIEGFRTLDKQGNIIFDTEITFKERYGSPAVSHMRTDFRAELLRLATAPSKDLGISGEPAKMVFNNGAQDIDPEAGEITLDNGTKVKADVIIVADGIHSHLRPLIAGADCPQPKKNGLTCCRVAVSASQAIKALGQLPDWWQNLETKDKRIQVFEAGDGSDRVIVIYPLRHTSYINMSYIFATREGCESAENSWYADGDHKEIMEIFDDYHPSLKALINASAEVKVWDLQDLEPLDRWTAGRAILIGDAAHAMTPMQGQGANICIEDAEAFRLLVEPGVTRDDVPAILKQIEKYRLPRAAAILSNTRKTSRGVSGEERYRVMNENCTYHGIFEAMKG